MSKLIYSEVKLKKPKIICRDLSKVRILDKEVDGLAYKYENLIEIEKTLTPKRLFYTYIHELVGHMLLPDLTEKQVLKLEKMIGDCLWKVVLKLNRKKNGDMA